MTQKISEAINQPYEGIQSYRNLMDVLGKAKADISFWGSRYITVENCQGRYPINELMKHVENIKDYSPGEDRQSSIELIHGIQTRINQLMETGGEKLEDAYLFTKLWVGMKELKDQVMISLFLEQHIQRIVASGALHAEPGIRRI